MPGRPRSASSGPGRPHDAGARADHVWATDDEIGALLRRLPGLTRVQISARLRLRYDRAQLQRMVREGQLRTERADVGEFAYFAATKVTV